MKKRFNIKTVLILFAGIFFDIMATNAWAEPFSLAGTIGTTALLGGAGWGLASMFGGDDDEEGMKKTSTLSPEQQAMQAKLLPYLTGKIGEGLPAWGGDWTASLGEGEEWGIGKYKEAVEGMDPKAVHDWYMEYMAPQEKRYMRQEVIPEIREAGVRHGTLYGTPTETRESKAWEGYGAGQMGRIGEAVMSERAGARASLPGYMQAAALPRLIEQEELNAQIQEFVRTTPELNPILNQALNAMGIQTQAAYYQPAQPSPFMQLASAVAPAVGSGMGAYYGSGGGATPTAVL